MRTSLLIASALLAAVLSANAEISSRQQLVTISRFGATRRSRRLQEQHSESGVPPSQPKAEALNEARIATSLPANEARVTLKASNQLEQHDPTPEMKPQSLLQFEDFRDCDFEITTVDTRRMADTTNHSIAEFLSNAAENFESIGALLNQAYAEKHGYIYRKIEPREVNVQKYGSAWNKAFHAAERLEELRSRHSSRCTWLMYLDFDSFFHEPETSLPEFLSRLAHKYSLTQQTSFIIGKQFGGPDINTGAFIIKVDDHSQSLLNTWIRLFNVLPAQGSMKTIWPLEQGALNSILLDEGQRQKYYNHPSDSADTVVPEEFINSLGPDVAHVRKFSTSIDLEEMNGHNGRFVEHVWHGARQAPNLDGTDHRFDLPVAAMKRGLADPLRFKHLVQLVQANTVKDWVPKLWLQASSS